MENEKIAIKWLEAFNKHNLDDLLNLYSESAKHYSPKLKLKKPETLGLITGKENLRNWWTEAFSNLPSLKYVPTTITANQNRVFMEYTRQVNGEADILVAEVLEIENNKIIASRVYHG